MNKSENWISESDLEGAKALVTKLLEASRQHDATGCAALFTDDGRIFPPYGAEVSGRDAIETTHKAWLDEGETNKRLEYARFARRTANPLRTLLAVQSNRYE